MKPSTAKGFGTPMIKKNDSTEISKSLSADDIEDVPTASRRTALGAVGGLLAVAVTGAVVLRPSEAAACRRTTGRNDSDPQDGAGHGRTGFNDSDSGDEPACGRPPQRRGPCTDSDSGRGADGVNRGRNCR